MANIEKLQQEIEPLRLQIINHSLYREIKTVEHLQLFMQHHVYAVWDFMSLLKSLQQHLTCVNVPWVPKGSAKIRYMINEIVVGEESDVDRAGTRMSHFEMYLNAMSQAGADTGQIMKLVSQINSGTTVAKALESNSTPIAAKEFVNNTFRTIQSGKPHLLAAVFTFGREDLIPGMFISFIKQLSIERPDKVNQFEYYLERHIEVDGGHHSQLALEMTEELCENDPNKWKEATEEVKLALSKRIALWDSVLAIIKANSLVVV